eukprot:scaffold8481_cov286-Pinguiococcus_pyrenoidosus.AAC.3
MSQYTSSSAASSSEARTRSAKGPNTIREGRPQGVRYLWHLGRFLAVKPPFLPSLRAACLRRMPGSLPAVIQSSTVVSRPKNIIPAEATALFPIGVCCFVKPQTTPTMTACSKSPFRSKRKKRMRSSCALCGVEGRCSASAVPGRRECRSNAARTSREAGHPRESAAHTGGPASSHREAAGTRRPGDRNFCPLSGASAVCAQTTASAPPSPLRLRPAPCWRGRGLSAQAPHLPSSLSLSVAFVGRFGLNKPSKGPKAL